MRVVKFGVILLAIVWLSGVAWLASVVLQGVTASGQERAKVKAQTALLIAEAQRDAIRADAQVKVIRAQERLEKVRLRSDPHVKASLVRALKVRAILSAWFPLYFPVFAFAGVASAVGVYYSFRLVTFRHDGIETPVRAFDAPRLVSQSLQVKALEATQGVDVLQLAEAISTRQLNTFSHLARGFRGFLGGREAPALITSQTALPAPQHVPTFADLLHADKFQQGDPLVFGFQQAGTPKQGTWQDAYSLGIAGLSGYGKSATIRFLMSESLLTGAVGEFFVIDPHFPHEKSLLTSLGSLKESKQVHYVENPLDTMDLIAEVNAAIDRRLKGEEASEPLMVVVIDELIPAVKKFPAISDLVERIGMESRKAGVYGIFASQSWNGDKTGGTTARDNLTALLVHRMKPKQANTLLQDSALAKQVTRLNPGQVLFAPTSAEPEILTVPYCSMNDMPEVVRRLEKQPTAKRMTVSDPTPPQATESEVDGLTDAQLIGRVNLKKGMMGNNEFARYIGQDEGLTSKSLRGLSMPLFPAMRTAFKKFLSV